MKKCLLCLFAFLLVRQMAVCQNNLKAPLLDSLKIAFVSYRTGTADIFLMNTDGSSIEQITDSEENNSFPYQIDERTIGFTRTDSMRNTSKLKIDIYTKEESEIEEDPVRTCAKWEVESLDNANWAFIRSNDYRDRELFMFDTQNGLEKQLTTIQDQQYAAYSINHSWSPDSKKLAFMSGPDWFNQFVRVYDLEQDSIYQITDTGYMNSGLKWLNDSKTLIANLKIKDKTLYEIYSIDITTGELKPLTSGINLHPDVSPDGNWIVFESQRHNNYGEAYLMKFDGSNQVRLTENPDYNGRCIWFKLY